MTARADSRAPRSVGSRIEINRVMIEMTTNSSIKVKPRAVRGFGGFMNVEQRAPFIVVFKGFYAEVNVFRYPLKRVALMPEAAWSGLANVLI